jgi:hypothetical protein
VQADYEARAAAGNGQSEGFPLKFADKRPPLGGGAFDEFSSDDEGELHNNSQADLGGGEGGLQVNSVIFLLKKTRYLMRLFKKKLTG